MSPSQKNTNSDKVSIPEYNEEITPEYVEQMVNIYVNGNDMFFNTLTGIDKIVNYIEFAYKLVLPPALRHRGLDALFHLSDVLVKNETRKSHFFCLSSTLIFREILKGLKNA